MTQETLRRHALRVLRCWRERFLFNEDYLNGLQVGGVGGGVGVVRKGEGRGTKGKGSGLVRGEGKHVCCSGGVLGLLGINHDSVIAVAAH